MAPLILYTKNIQTVFNCSHSTATRKMNLLRDVYGKKKHQVVTIGEFCKYFDLPLKEVTSRL